ncbi:hypothetical protein GEMRC1_006493 [Eukaryota sp. GEM-RC1]
MSCGCREAVRLNEDLLTLQEKLSQLESDFVHNISVIEARDKEITKLEDSLSTLQHHLSQKESDISDLKASLATSKSERDAAVLAKSDSINSQQRFLLENERTIAHLSRENSKLTTQLKEQRRVIDNLELENEGHKKVVEMSKAETSAKTNECHDLMTRIDDVIHQLSETKEELTRVARERDVSLAQNDEVNDLLLKEKETNCELLNQNSKLEDQISQLNDEFSQINKQKLSIDSECDKLRDEVSEAKREKFAIETECNKCKAEISSLSDQLSDNQSKINSLEKIRDRFKRKLTLYDKDYSI